MSKVSSYETSQYLFNTAMGYYTAVKNVNPLVKKSCETVEAGIKTLNSSVIEPVVHTEAYKRYTEPILTSVDDFGCRQLEKIEAINDKVQENVKTSKDKLNYWRDELKHKGVVSTSWELVQEGEDRIGQVIGPKVAPVDNYLKDSYLAVPINLALTVTEKVTDPFLPASPEGERKAPLRVGPITRATKLSKRVQLQLQNLTMRPPGQVSYYVDLINYAATQLDSSVKTTNEYFSQKGQQVTDIGRALVEKGQKRIGEELIQVRSTVAYNTREALSALQRIVEQLADRIPKDKVEQLRAKVNNMSEGWLKLETEEDASLFSKVAKRSMKKLEKVKERLAQYSTTDAIPARIITSVGTTVNSVVDRFLNMAHTAQENIRQSRQSKKEGEAESEESEESEEEGEEMHEAPHTSQTAEATK